MKTSLSQLAKNLEEKAKLIDKGASKIAISAALTVLGDLVFVTPVDTSKALSNWQVSLNTKIASEIGPYFPGNEGSTKGPSAREAFAIGKATLKNKKPGDTIYISNVTDYIGYLNYDGISKQEPSFFVERAVKLGALKSKKVKIKL